MADQRKERKYAKFFNICEKAITGTIMSEKDFDIKVLMPKLSELARKYGVKCDKENPVPCDDKALLQEVETLFIYF